MKAFNWVRSFIFIFIILFQNLLAASQKKFFVRIYSMYSSGIIKGFYAGHNDSALILIVKNRADTISYSVIRQIRTRRSTGHQILISTAIGALTGTAIGIITHKDRPAADPNCQLCNIISDAFTYSQTEDAEIGGLAGAVTGAAIGTLTGLVRKKETYTVAGNFQNWQAIKIRLESWPVYASPDNNL